MRYHIFEQWHKKFAIEKLTGDFFEVDSIGEEFVSLLNEKSDSEVIDLMTKRYGREKTEILASFLESSQSTDCSCENPARDITDLTLNIVNYCNLSCVYCWNEKGSYAETPNTSMRLMSEDTMKAAVSTLLNNTSSKRLVVDFYGGEPLLNYELIRSTVNYCKKIEESSDIKFTFLLATNGTLLTKERAEFLVLSGVDVAISLDGPQQVQDRQRPFADGCGSFDQIKANLDSFPEDIIRKIVGRATVTPTSGSAVEIFKYLRSLGFDRIEVCESEMAGYGLGKNNPYFFEGEEGIAKLKEMYSELARFYTAGILDGSLTYENTYFNRFFKQLSRLYHISSIQGSCSAGLSLIAADIDGLIYPCTAFVGIKQHNIGHVDTGISDDLLSAFNNSKLMSHSDCQKCWASQICKGCGSCYNLNYFSSSSIDTPDDYYCELFRFKTELMIWMIAEVAEKDPDKLDQVLIPEFYAQRGITADFPSV